MSEWLNSALKHRTQCLLQWNITEKSVKMTKNNGKKTNSVLIFYSTSRHCTWFWKWVGLIASLVMKLNWYEGVMLLWTNVFVLYLWILYRNHGRKWMSWRRNWKCWRWREIHWIRRETHCFQRCVTTDVCSCYINTLTSCGSCSATFNL